jgi:hypothetical protein
VKTFQKILRAILYVLLVRRILRRLPSMYD